MATRARSTNVKSSKLLTVGAPLVLMCIFGAYGVAELQKGKFEARDRVHRTTSIRSERLKEAERDFLLSLEAPAEYENKPIPRAEGADDEYGDAEADREAKGGSKVDGAESAGGGGGGWKGWR